MLALPSVLSVNYYDAFLINVLSQSKILSVFYGPLFLFIYLFCGIKSEAFVLSQPLQEALVSMFQLMQLNFNYLPGSVRLFSTAYIILVQLKEKTLIGFQKRNINKALENWVTPTAEGMCNLCSGCYNQLSVVHNIFVTLQHTANPQFISKQW